MFGSNPFGQTSTSPFGAQPAFGQTNNAATNNPFAPKPFGSPSPFGSQSGSSIFGGTSTGVFGSQPSSSALGSTSVFGASSSPAFGATSAFGQQKPSFGGFGTTTTQTTPFGQQQSQPAFGTTPFGSSPSPFGAQSQPAFGQTTSSGFGTTNAQPFGGSSTPGFGSTPSPTFGTTSGGFGVSSSPFGASAPAFNTTPASGFGAPTTSAFGTTNFGAPTTSGFGNTNFGAASAPAFGNSPATSNFNFGASSAFGQQTPAPAFANNSPFGTTTPQPFGAPQTSGFGAQTSTPSFGQTAFGGQQRVGSRVAPYSSTPETDATTGSTPAKLESISAMTVYKDKSHEELRWEDYQAGDKGGPNPAGQSTTSVGFGTPGGVGTSTPTFGQTAANPFTSTTPANPFAAKTPAVNSTPFGSTTTTQFGGTSPFGTSNPFGASSSSTTPSIFGSTTTTPGFGVNTASGFGSTSPFGSSAQGTTSAFGTGIGFGNTQTPSLFPSANTALPSTSNPFGQNTSAFGQTGSVFGQTGSAFGQTGSAYGQTGSAFGQTGSAFGQTGSAFGQAGIFGAAPASTFGGSTMSNSSFPSNSLFGQPAPMQPAPSVGTFNINNNFGQSQAAPTNGFFGHSTFGQMTAPQNNVVTQAAPVTNPYGTLPAMPQMSISRPGTSPSIQYGISSLPAVEKLVAPRVSSLLSSRHLSQRRMRLPVRKYHPNTDGPRVAFFVDDEETQSTPKADAGFVPRENPRALVIRPLEQWPSRSSVEKTTVSKVNGTVHGNGTSEEPVPVSANEQVNHVNGHEKTNGFHDTRKDDSLVTLTGHRAGEAAIVYEHGADIEALMPKLRHSDYYTEPRIQEIAAKERAEPGYCRHVKDFVVGRKGFGSIKLFGETDVRRLDLESLVQFNNREVLVYMDESKKPPVGQGLNKAAEVSLLNIKCVDKSGQQLTEGPRVDKYRETLKRKAEEQGAEFVSYDPVKGEWKFRVEHFSKYGFSDDEDGSAEGGLC